MPDHSIEPWYDNDGSIFAADDTYVCEVMQDEHGSDGPELRVNRRLITAAPDLLAALLLFMEQYDGKGRENRPEIAAARNAIARATGSPAL